MKDNYDFRFDVDDNFELKVPELNIDVSAVASPNVNVPPAPPLKFTLPSTVNVPVIRERGKFF